jgi:hypothetical protein
MYGEHMLRAAALVLTLLFLAGCGTTAAPEPRPVASTTTTEAAAPAATPAMTHAEFVKALNASCANGKDKADKLEKRFESAMERNALPEAGRLYQSLLTLLSAHLTRIDRLEVPAEDRAAMRRYTRAQQRIVGYGDRMTRALLDNDIEGVNLLVPSFQSERVRRATAAIDIGADECGT